MRMSIVAFAAVLLSACCPPATGYHTSSIAEALLATGQTVLNYPEMVVPHDAKTQHEMEQAADHQGPMVAPEGILGPDLFLQDTGMSDAQYANQTPQRHGHH